MLKEETRFYTRVYRFVDIVLTAVSFVFAYLLKVYYLPYPLRGLTIKPNYYVVLLLIIIIWYLVLEEFGIYRAFTRLRFRQIFAQLLKAVSSAMVILAFCFLIFRIDDISRLMMGIFFLINISLLTLQKWLAYTALVRYRRRGFNLRNVLVVGARERAVELLAAIREHEFLGIRVLGCLELDSREIGRTVLDDVRVIDTVDRLPQIILEQVVDEIIFAMPLKKIVDFEKYIVGAEAVGVTVRIVPDWQINRVIYNPEIARISIDDFFGVITLSLTTTPPFRGELFVKYVFDYVFAAIALILLVPLLLIIAAAIRLSSMGPVFFLQERCGLNGRKFMVYKFRTMVADAEARKKEVEALNEADGPAFKVSRDPRIIPWLGTFLRKSGLDELPQLINILKGEMSLIGPRPPIPSEVEQYETWQRRRISMKPGITCLWQIIPNRNDVSFEKWMEMDLEYIDNWSLWLDFTIFWRTIWAMVIGTGR